MYFQKYKQKVRSLIGWTVVLFLDRRVLSLPQPVLVDPNILLMKSTNMGEKTSYSVSQRSVISIREQIYVQLLVYSTLHSCLFICVSEMIRITPLNRVELDLTSSEVDSDVHKVSPSSLSHRMLKLRFSVKPCFHPCHLT